MYKFLCRYLAQSLCTKIQSRRMQNKKKKNGLHNLKIIYCVAQRSKKNTSLRYFDTSLRAFVKIQTFISFEIIKNELHNLKIIHHANQKSKKLLQFF